MNVLCTRHDGFAVEESRITSMTRRVPAHGVAADSGLNKVISAQSWGMVEQKPADRTENAGLRVKRVAPHGTGQDFSGCGATDSKSLRERVHRCAGCGLILDRDPNAARDILWRSGLPRVRHGAHDVCCGDERTPPQAVSREALTSFI